MRYDQLSLKLDHSDVQTVSELMRIANKYANGEEIMMYETKVSKGNG